MNEVERIVCATRGGEGSRAVQLAAIGYAHQYGASLTFLYITDAASLEGVEPTLVRAVKEELTWMGNTLLRIAQKRANQAAVEARIEVRVGDIRSEIGRFLKEIEADLLLLGAPRGTTANVFGDDEVELFATAVHNETGISVQVIRPEDGAMSSSPVLLAREHEM